LKKILKKIERTGITYFEKTNERLDDNLQSCKVLLWEASIPCPDGQNKKTLFNFKKMRLRSVHRKTS